MVIRKICLGCKFNKIIKTLRDDTVSADIARNLKSFIVVLPGLPYPCYPIT